ncbi:MAG: sugar phosphate isomerase/epimerase [Planctomycetes bacterium]|nr:sugar phosphate isomerase/epimerase [Planctomycetota bacterium]
MTGFDPATAAEPGGPLHAPFSKMKLSLAAYSLRKFMHQNWPRPRPRKTKPQLTMEGFVDYCGKLKLDGTEVTSYYFPAQVTDAYLAGLKSRAARQKLEISGTAIGNNFCLPDGPARQRELKLCRQWIDFAAMMGAPVIRIFAGRISKGENEKTAIKRCIQGIDESLVYAAKKKVGLALENHGGITSTPEQMLRIVKGVKPSAWFGVNFDSGNFRSDDPYRDLAQIAPYAINVQIKVAVTRKGKKEPADLKRTLAILDDAGYRGWVALEYEERGDPYKEIPRYVDQLRDLIGSLPSRKK